MLMMIKNIDFRNVHNKLQEKLKHDITEIKNSSKVIVPVHKTSNEDYDKCLRWNITKT